MPFATSFLTSHLPLAAAPPPPKVFAAMYPLNDPRRKVIVAFTRMFNAMGDRTAFHRLLRRHLTQDCQWSNRYVGRQNPYGPMSVRLDGITAIGEYYDTAARLSPDMVQHLQASDVLLRGDGSAVIVSQSLLLGTKIFRAQVEGCQHVEVNRDGEAVASASAPASSDTSAASSGSLRWKDAEDASLGSGSGSGSGWELDEEDRDIDELLGDQLRRIDLADRALVDGEQRLVVAALNLTVAVLHAPRGRQGVQGPRAAHGRAAAVRRQVTRRRRHCVSPDLLSPSPSPSPPPPLPLRHPLSLSRVPVASVTFNVSLCRPQPQSPSAVHRSSFTVHSTATSRTRHWPQ